MDVKEGNLKDWVVAVVASMLMEQGYDIEKVNSPNDIDKITLANIKKTTSNNELLKNQIKKIIKAA